MSPADQPPAIDWRRSTDPPTLWLSLALGSVLLHLVFFIVVSVVLTRTAKVQLEVEPIAVEFVDPKADPVQARSAAPSRAIAARPGAPSSSFPSATQAQPSAPRSQSSDFTPPVEQPVIPQPIRRSRSPRVLQPQFTPSSNPPQQPNLLTTPTPPQLTSPVNSPPQQPKFSNQSQGQPGSGTSPPQNGLPAASSPGNSAPGTTESQQPVRSGNPIEQLPQGRSVTVAVLSLSPTVDDVQRQPARLLDREKTVSLDYPPTLAKQTIHLRATIDLETNGLVVDVLKVTLLSSESGVDQDTLKDIARQIFISSGWRFEPAQDAQEDKLLMPSRSSPIIDAQVQLP